ncbi:MAG: VWA domain-containing protein, partial [Gammaproteobacteria bacterium]|nr:VWA domain-containing protein [Gammaproteobacteria bacterium]
MNVFSLSFLDVMSCGFGAVVLVFLIMNHSSERTKQEVNVELLSEVARLEELILEGDEYLVQVKNTVKILQEKNTTTDGLANTVDQNLKSIRVELAKLDLDTLASEESINKLKTDLQAQDEERRRLEGGVEEGKQQGENVRSFTGEGNRQYLTGMQMGGERVLILLDASASMLDETIVNVIRRRNMRPEQKLAARKWRRAVKTVEWLTAQIPPGSQFQFYTFNTTATPLLEGTRGRWLAAADGSDLNRAVESLRHVVPEKGTSLHASFQVISTLSPRPDNVFLLVDGLPTQGETIREKGV